MKKIKNILQKIERIIFDLLHFLRKKIYKIIGKKTFGVRAIVIDQNKILLVQHRYGNLWVMPGGKISKKYVLDKNDFQDDFLKNLFDTEPIVQYKNKIVVNFAFSKKELLSKLAIIEELKQEVGLKIMDCQDILGIYDNFSGGKNDEVTVFIIKKWQKIKNYKKRFIDILEIKQEKWFDLDNLPENLSSATKKRILEFISNKKNIIDIW